MATKIERLMENTLTVAELIELLEDYDRDAKVVLVADYGDRSHTQQAIAIKGITSNMEDTELVLTETAYSKSGVEVAEYDCDDHDNEELEQLQCEVVFIGL